MHTWTRHCICSSVRFLGTHLAHTRRICSISVTMCRVHSKEVFSEAESLRNFSLRLFSNSSAALATLTSVTAVDGLPEHALSITHVLPSLKCLHHWNTAARLSVSPPYACRNISSVSLPFFPSLTQHSITHLCHIFTETSSSSAMTKCTRCFHSLWANTEGHSCPTAGSDRSKYDFHKT